MKTTVLVLQYQLKYKNTIQTETMHVGTCTQIIASTMKYTLIRLKLTYLWLATSVH